MKGMNYMDKHIAPHMWTVRQVAKTGLLPETALRTLNRQGKLPAIRVGNTTYINYEALCEMLNRLGEVG